MITEISQDLITTEVDAIAHCANCFTTMGSGIAKRIKSEFPEAFDSDKKTPTGDILKLGTFSVATTTNNQYMIKYVYNLYGQYYYGKDSRKLNYEAIYTAMQSMRNDCYAKDITSIGFPKNMGCSLAGGDWQVVESMIHSIFDESPFTVLICSYNPDKK